MTDIDTIRLAGEMMQRNSDRQRMAPVALVALSKDEHVADLFFQGLRQHYIECLLAGRLDLWANAAHSAIDLMASPTTPVEKRNPITKTDQGAGR